MTTIYLAEISAHDGTSALTLRYSSGVGYSDPSAPGFYEPRILQPLSLRRTAFGSGTTGGAIQVGIGELILTNADGGLDALLGYGFDGRRLAVLIGDDRAAYSTFTTVFVGTMEQPAFEFSKVSILARDRLAELERKPANATKYAGSNALPNGLEGVPGDLQGRPKPRVYGRVLNVAPPMVNSSRLIYQINDGAVQDVPNVYDRGLGLTKGTDYTSQSDMETTAPAAGNYRVWPAGGYFRLGSTPAGLITADVTQGATTAARTAAQVLQALATGPGGIAGGDVVSGDVTALDTANGAELGIWIADETSVRAVMETVANSIGAWFGFDRLGRLRMVRLTAPTGSPVATLRYLTAGAVADATTADIVSIERVPANDRGAGVPSHRAILSYQRNHSVQPTDLAGAVTAARREFLKLEYRTVISTDASVLTKHLLAGERAFESLVLDATAAQTEADRLRDLFKVRRDRLRVVVKWDASLAAVVDLGSVVSVAIPRFGYDAGRLFVVIGIENDAANDTAELELWG